MTAHLVDIGAPTQRTPGERAAVLLLWTALGGTLLGGVLPLRFLPVLLPLLALLVALRAGPGAWAGSRLPVALLVLVGWILLSWTWSAEPAGSVRSFVDLLGAVSVGVVVGTVLDLDRMRRALATLIKALLIANVAALVLAPDFSTRPPENDPIPGWHALMGHKNGLGAFLVLAVAVLLFESARRRLLWLLVIGVLLVGSQSASGLGVCLVLVALALWGATLRGVEAPSLRAAGRILSLALFGAGVALLASAPSLVARSLGRSATLTGRTQIWGPVFERIRDNPALGLGWGGVWRETSPVTQELWREARFPAFYAHNGYLDVLLQVGAVGGALFLLLLLSTFAALLSGEHRSHAWWGVLVLLGLCLTAITESSPFTGSVGLLLISLLSTVVQRGRHRSPPLSSHPLLRPPAGRAGSALTPA